ncbi:MAG: glycosyltransferase family 2 protein [Planctomycetota bacterium]|jgi:glycosyltransferase involved in cell wall biosynthesis
MKVSLIIPVYNAEETIEQCLGHIMGQERLPEEILLVDNGSTDNSVKKMQDFIQNNKNISIILLHEEKKGAAAARNKGLVYATGDIIAFTDSDCFPRKDWLKNMLYIYEKDNLDGLGGLTYIYNPRIPVEKMQAIDLIVPQNRQAKIILQKHEPLFSIFIATFNASYRHDVLKKIGGFDEGLFLAGEDVDCTIRAFEEKFKMCVWHPDVVVWHMPRKNFLSYGKTIFQYRRVLPTLLKKHFKNKAFIQIPRFGIKKIPFFTSLVITQEFEMLIFFVSLVLFFYRPFSINTGVIIIIILFIRAFIYIIIRRRFIDVEISIFEALKINVLDVVKKIISEYGRIYGSIRERTLYI